MTSTDFIVPSLVNGLAVFVGLIALWSILGFATMRQRISYAAIAAIFAAVAAFVISDAVGT